MDKSNDNERLQGREDQDVFLGTASVETKGLAGAGEPYGTNVLPGISEE